MLEIIELTAKGQCLTLVKENVQVAPSKIASHTVSLIEAHFSLDETWDYPYVKAVFVNSRGVKKSVFLEDSKCVVPWEVMLDEGEVKVNLVAGIIENCDCHLHQLNDVMTERMTSYKTACLIIAQKINVSACASLPPTPDEWEQVQARIERELKNKLGEAPKDGRTYARKDGEWLDISDVSGATYEFEQRTAEDTWLIVHNLSKYPSVTVVDSGKTQVIGDIEYINKNSLVITFNAPFSGKAYLN